MGIDRRQFVQGAGLLAGLLPAGASVATADRESANLERAFKFDTWARLRDEFDQDYSWRNFAGFLLASRPRLVEQAIQHHRTQLNRNAPMYLPEVYRLEAQGRAQAAHYLGVQTPQIAMTGNTTMGLATLYNTIRIKPNQEVLVTEHEHYSCRTSIQYRAEREGFRVNTIRLYDEPRHASADEMVDRIRANVTSNTRVLALSWVHSGSSIKLPASEVAKLVRHLNKGRDENDRLLFCLDGVHGFGVENTNFDTLGCDYFVAGTHKWMFGPSGTGIMCSRETTLENVSPTIPPFNYTGENTFGTQMTPGGFHTFEHKAAVGKAFEFHEQIGKHAVEQRIHFLNDYLKTQLEELDGVELVTPMGAKLSAGFTFFRVPTRPATEITEIMQTHKIIASAADRDAGPVVRLAPGIINTEKEIDTVMTVLRKIVG